MGELAERYHGVPSGGSLPGDMTKISELHAVRLKPTRSFQMKTAKSRAYSVPSGLKGCEDPQQDTISFTHTQDTQRSKDWSSVESIPVPERTISSLTKRNHEFDIRKPGKANKGILRKFGEQPRGVQSVRSYYKVDESKILPSISLGITEDMLFSPTK